MIEVVQFSTGRRAITEFITMIVPAAGISLGFPATALADDQMVTYEVTSDSVATAKVEYFTGAQLQLSPKVPLPWTVDAPVGDLSRDAKTANHAEIRADWDPGPSANAAVTVRIRYKGKTICQSTSETGKTSCYYATFSSYVDPSAPAPPQ